MDGVAEEVFSTLFGLDAQGKMFEDNSMGVWNRITNLASESTSIVDFIRQAINSVFGPDANYELSMNDSLVEIIDKLGSDIAFGNGSILSELDTSVMKDIEYMIDPTEMREDIINRLKKLNSIKRVCV